MALTIANWPQAFVLEWILMLRKGLLENFPDIETHNVWISVVCWCQLCGHLFSTLHVQGLNIDSLKLAIWEYFHHGSWLHFKVCVCLFLREHQLKNKLTTGWDLSPQSLSGKQHIPLFSFGQLKWSIESYHVWFGWSPFIPILGKGLSELVIFYIHSSR